MNREPQEYRRILVAAGCVAGYLLAFLPLFYKVGQTAAAISIVPVGIIGLFWGVRAGALAAAVFAPVNTLLLNIGGVAGWDVLFRPLVLPGAIGSIIVGTITGGLRDLRAEALRESSERQRAHLRLRESESRFRALIEKSSDAIALIDAEGTVLYASPSTRELLGYTPEEFLGMRPLVLMHPDDVAGARERLARLTAGTRTTSSEFRVRHKDGTYRWIKSISTNLLDDPSVRAIVINYRDISGRKQAEQALRDSESRLRAIHEAALDCIITIDHEGRILEFNPAAERTFGYARADVLGKSLADLIIPARAREDHRRGLAQHAATGESTYLGKRFERTAVRADGSEFPVEVTVTCISTAGPPIYTGYLRDITERKSAEDAIRTAQAHLERRVEERTSELGAAKSFLEHLVAASPGVVFRFDLSDFRPTYVSPNLERLYGYTVEEFLASPTFWTGLIHPDDFDRLLSKLRRVLGRRADYVAHETRIRHKDGTYRWVYAYAVPERNDAGEPIAALGYALDITEQKRVERSLEEARREAEHANRTKSEFISRMSHELRTPLNSILGFAQLLEMEIHGAEASELISHILKGGRHLLELINEVLDISRIETGRLELSTEPIAVGEVIEESLDLIAPLAAQRNVQLNRELVTGYEGYVRADRQRLKQVLLNLLSNAVKYNREGGTVAVTCTETPQGRRRINVIDTGSGIPPHKVELLFRPFERLGQTAVEGTGIGLAVSRGLAQLMGGEMGVETHEGQGSTFWVELDPAESPLAPYGRAIPEPSPVGSADGTPQRRTILYVEENLSNLETIRRALDGRGEIALLTAATGRRGVDLAREQRPDLIFLDLHLTDMSAMDVMRELREDARTKWMPVVVIGAEATPAQRAQLLAHGARAYLTKPLDLNRLFALLDDSLMVGGPTGHAKHDPVH
jgi:PAS domain S-box-containing protein